MALNITNSDYIFSLYHNLLTVDKPDDHISINQLYETIKYGKVKQIIELLRSANLKEEYNRIKRESIPCVTLSGKFEYRNSKGLISHSGLIQIDIDHVKDINKVFDAICKDDYTYMCFISPGGKGLKVVVKINPSAETHLEQFYALEEYYKEFYNLEIDKACKDISRCMLLSYDPNIYYNSNSLVYEELFISPTKEVKQPTRTNYRPVDNHFSDSKVMIEKITRALEHRHIDITESYDSWIRVGYALCAELGEGGRSYFHRISAMYPEYTRNEADKTYSRLLNSNDERIKLGSLIYLAKQSGIDLKPPSYDKTQKTIKKNPLSKPKFDKEELLQQLKDKRQKISKEKDLPAYMICSNKTLEEMASKSPTSLEEFLNISGISYERSDKYARHFLPLIRKYKGINGPLNLVDDNFHKKKDLDYDLNPAEKKLFDELKRLRMRIANEKHLKPYYVFTNPTLLDIIKYRPKTISELKEINGIGEKKSVWFGKEILELVKIHN